MYSTQRARKKTEMYMLEGQGGGGILDLALGN